MKWVIQRNNDNYKIINNYCNIHYPNRNFTAKTEIYVYSEKHDGTHYSSDELKEGYQLLTTQEFRQFVLKENIIIENFQIY